MCIGMGCLYCYGENGNGCSFKTHIDDDGAHENCWFDGLQPEDYEFILDLNRKALQSISDDEEDLSN